MKLTKKVAHKKEVVYKIEVFTKFMHVFCIAAFYIAMRFRHDDFGMCFLSRRHSYYFFVGVVHFILLLLLLQLLLLLLLLLMLLLMLS